MKVKILNSFSDKEFKKVLLEGETVEMSEERVEYIISQNENLIEPLEEFNDVFPRHLGGGYYVLSNGEKIKGKEEAIKAEEELSINE
ncbi:MAG: hypothetical protein RIN55_05600 [Tissierellaceae bacterium]|nr:hypothetical protein [Tissierellaceae bacterium]